MTRAQRRGFTLVEILVALAIVAVALAAGMRALAQAADGATALKARTLALWVAQNRLAAAQLADRLAAAPGARDGDATQAGARFVWRETVSGHAESARFARSRSSSREPRRAGLRARAPGRLPRQRAAVMRMRAAMRARGFTLIEVLIALAILARRRACSPIARPPR